MSETVVLADAEGNYYAFDAEDLAAAKTTDEDGEYYDVAGEDLADARVPDDQHDAIEAAVGVDEVSGFGDPIPGIDVKLGKNRGGQLRPGGVLRGRAHQGCRKYRRRPPGGHGHEVALTGGLGPGWPSPRRGR